MLKDFLLFTVLISWRFVYWETWLFLLARILTLLLLVCLFRGFLVVMAELIVLLCGRREYKFGVVAGFGLRVVSLTLL